MGSSGDLMVIYPLVMFAMEYIVFLLENHLHMCHFMQFVLPMLNLQKVK